MNTEEIESELYKAQQFMLKIFPSDAGELAKLLIESFARGYDEAKPKWRSVKDDPPRIEKRVLVRWISSATRPTVGWYHKLSQGGQVWGYDREFIFGSPDEWMEIPE